MHPRAFESCDKARNEVGRPDLRFHDLRHTGAVMAARAGATLAELQARLGHSTATAAMRYQHASEQDAEIASGCRRWLLRSSRPRCPNARSCLICG